MQWRDFYEERAGIYEFDAGLSRPAAERAAFQSCVVQALVLFNRHRADIGTGRPGIAWPQGKQLYALFNGQMKKAEEMLREMGIAGRLP